MAKRASFSAISGKQSVAPAAAKPVVEQQAERSLPVVEVVVEEPDVPVIHTHEVLPNESVPEPDKQEETILEPEELIEEELDGSEEQQREAREEHDVRDMPVAEQSEPEQDFDIPSMAPAPAMTQKKEVEIADLFHKVEPESSEQHIDIEDTGETQESAFPEITLTENEGMKPGVFWAIAIVVATLIIGGALIAVKRGALGRSVIPMLAKPTPTSAPTPTVLVTPTPTMPAVSKKDIKISVLNGGGVKGAAGDMKKLLEAKGYIVASTGNAPDFTYDKTAITVKFGKEDLLTVLGADIGSEYPLGTTSATLSKSSAVDAQVIVGKK
jgi:hypothetical protein